MRSVPERREDDGALSAATPQHYFAQYAETIHRQTDRLFAWLFVLEWIGAVLTALFVSPRTWTGTRPTVHPHVYAAFGLGLTLIAGPLWLIWREPGRALTRHTVALCQMLMSVLLIDLSGGRIETHFHIFGSLAFLACYRDWRVLITASLVTAIDHLVRGIWWPQSVYGLLTVTPWRWVEHVFWVGFEDIFLIFSCRRSLTEMHAIAQREAGLHHGAHHDVLTGLANRAGLQRHFADFQECRAPSSSKTAVLFVDLDRFKEVNDTLGHNVGDELLTAAARRLSETMRGGDLAGRIGGDEFLLIAHGIVDGPDALRTANLVLGCFQQPFVLGPHHLFLSASIGVAIYPDHGGSLAALQAAADLAMYEAKTQGRNQARLFDQQTESRIQTRHSIEHDLHTALTQRQFELYYQPQFNARRELTGVEALLRWHHPVHGLIAPSTFIPLAEQSGLIVPLGEWVLQEACRQAQKWNSASPARLRIAVNVSSVQLEQEDFAASVEAALAAAGLDPSLLELELTESTFLANQERTLTQLQRLRQKGVQIAIDDFGTGYSSFSSIGRLPVDRLKIDRSFLSPRSGTHSTIVSSVIQMAHDLGLTVIAEGVECNEQITMLQNIDCDELQGYYFSPPVPATEFEAYLGGPGDLARLEAGIAAASATRTGSHRSSSESESSLPVCEESAH